MRGDFHRHQEAAHDNDICLSRGATGPERQQLLLNFCVSLISKNRPLPESLLQRALSEKSDSRQSHLKATHRGFSAAG